MKTMTTTTLMNKTKLDSFVKVESIMVVGRRWFEKTNGNTYHTAEIYINNEFINKIDLTYGYGDQYYWSAWQWLLKNNYVGIDAMSPRIYCEKNKI